MSGEPSAADGDGEGAFAAALEPLVASLDDRARAAILPDFVRRAASGDAASLALVPDADDRVDTILHAVANPRDIAEQTAALLRVSVREIPADAGVVDGRMEVGEHGQLAVLMAPVAHRGHRIALACAVAHELRGFTALDRHLFEIVLPWIGAQLAPPAAAVPRDDERAESESREARLRGEIVASERERQRWARDLHDELLQALGVVRFRLAAALEGPKSTERAAINHAVAGLGAQIDGLRDLIDDLRPAVLDQLGLGPALAALVDRTRRATSARLDVRLALGDAEERLSDDTELLVYRLVQETLQNVSKHAAASTVRVAVARRGQRLELLVADDGSGFDVTATTRGTGLVGVRERVALARGELEIRSRPGVGTTVEIALPL